MQNDKASVIVPVYNTEKFLYKCIDSIVNQSHKNIEIILVNDGSTDNSLSICKEFANKDNRIILINKGNEGASSARNVGLELSTGNYIGFVDSDDYISGNMYEVLISTIIKHNADIVECGYYRVAENNNIIKKTLNNEVISNNYKCNYDYIRNVNSYHMNCNKLYKREIIKNSRFSDFKYDEDFLFNLHAYNACNKKVNIDECLYFYVNNPKSAMNKPFSKENFDRIKAVETAIDFYKQKSVELSRFVIYYLLHIIRTSYERLTVSDIIDKKEYEKYLIDLYFEHYPIIKKNLLKIAKTKKGFMANKIFAINPKLYCLIKNISKNNK